MTILVSHPTGNANVRAILTGFYNAKLLHSFFTTLAISSSSWFIKALPLRFKKRVYNLPKKYIHIHPVQEIIRLVLSAYFKKPFSKNGKSLSLADVVYRDLDAYVANYIPSFVGTCKLGGVYCYEDGAFETFKIAKQLGIKCYYDLPIAYWETSQQLLREEAQRLPEWEPTLIGTKDSAEKLERKTKELMLADAVICPSKFVYDSLPQNVKEQKKCITAKFGSPSIRPDSLVKAKDRKKPLRVLFVGSMTQRKGLADLFRAMKLLNRSDIQLIVMGSPAVNLGFYRKQYSKFIYKPPRSHEEVLSFMRSCDIFVLPSIVEGRALAQQEAMSCSLPIIITPNTGGEDLIEEGKTGFLIPIRSPELIAQKIAWFADNRNKICEMSISAKKKANSMTWEKYGEKIITGLDLK